MGRYARGIWSDAQIMNALKSSGEKRFRADILRDGAKHRELSLASGSSVTMDTDGDILLTGRIALYEPIDWASEEIQPYMMLRMEDDVQSSSELIDTWFEFDTFGLSWQEFENQSLTVGEDGELVFMKYERNEQFADFSLGVLIPSTPKRTGENGTNTWAVEAYDRTIILKESGIYEPLFIAAGTLYLDAIQARLASLGITSVMISDYVDTALPADTEFDIGTSNLKIINTLLSEINFNPIYCDPYGRFVLEAYKEPDPSSFDFEYIADEESIIGLDTTSETDYGFMPNVWIAVCSNPDLETDFRSVYINDNPLSEFSTVRRGRQIVSEIYRPDRIASQADLDIYIRRIAYEAMMAATEKVAFPSATVPVHWRADDLAVQHPDINGAYRETRWTIPLEYDGQMEHAARRKVLM